MLVSVVSVGRPLSAVLSRGCRNALVGTGGASVRRLTDSDRISQLSYVTVASRERPNFARISRKTPPPKFRKTLRETLT